MNVLLILASVAIIGVMAIVHYENRQDFLNACENYFRYTGHRHHLDPKATIEDLEKCFKKAQGGEKKGEL